MAILIKKELPIIWNRFSPAPFLAPHLSKRKIRKKTAMLKGRW